MMEKVSSSALDELKDHLEDPENLVEMKYLLLEQKYLELLAKNSRLEALKVQTELAVLIFNIEFMFSS